MRVPKATKVTQTPAGCHNNHPMYEEKEKEAHTNHAFLDQYFISYGTKNKKRGIDWNAIA